MGVKWRRVNERGRLLNENGGIFFPVSDISFSSFFIFCCLAAEISYSHNCENVILGSLDLMSVLLFTRLVNFFRRNRLKKRKCKKSIY